MSKCVGTLSCIHHTPIKHVLSRSIKHVRCSSNQFHHTASTTVRIYDGASPSLPQFANITIQSSDQTKPSSSFVCVVVYIQYLHIYVCIYVYTIAIGEIMFAPQRPDAAEARRELVGNVTLFVASVVVIRATTYVLSILQKKD